MSLAECERIALEQLRDQVALQMGIYRPLYATQGAYDRAFAEVLDRLRLRIDLKGLAARACAAGISREAP